MTLASMQMPVERNETGISVAIQLLAQRFKVGEAELGHILELDKALIPLQRSFRGNAMEE